MKQFNAESARQMVQLTKGNELDRVLSRIEESAKKGKREVHLLDPITPLTKSELICMGFEILYNSIVRINSIYW